ncbi:GNAT family N-acetyltransferase [Pontibacter qinzhouensis]|uniref:GNAT family N-acetyltransferase n=1 Tax=Pontibacter qinzhouensis TaxID=2603253 RepID=A0A5C8J4B1_9BACT|nr:GNAT family N-acetyltransferase [Pontibacter qinzhouensis]TXK31561.1 GNAT family N-acetyltransferase [Pontibacter qinzhouensis]
MITTAVPIQIVDFDPAHATAFRALNEEWITRYFELEEADIKSLSNPQAYILAKGGFILMALYHGDPVGACALLREEANVFELAKMAVTEKAQGLKIGKALGKAALAKAKGAGAAKVYLVSNRKLHTALSLYQKLGFKEVPMPPSIYKRADIKMEIDLLA